MLSQVYGFDVTVSSCHSLGEHGRSHSISVHRTELGSQVCQRLTTGSDYCATQATFAERRRGTDRLKYDLSQAASFVPKTLGRSEPSLRVTCLSSEMF